MRRSVHQLAAATLAFTFVAGCGVTVRPHVGPRDADQPPGGLGGARVNPRSTPEIGLLDDTQPVIDQVCRAQPMRSGWIAISYVKGGDDCPVSSDPANPYTAAVIERYSNKPVDATMMVCADQSIPLQWVREYNRDVGTQCTGAKVPDGAATAMVIRRVGAGR